eukprot:gene31419-40813_t
MEMTSPAARNDEEEQHDEGLASEGDVKGDTSSCKPFSSSRPLQDSLEALRYLQIAGPPDGLFLSSKSKLWSPVFPIPPTISLGIDNNCSSSFDPHPRPFDIVYEPGVSLLGGIISKDPDFFLHNALLRVQKWRSNVELLSQFSDPQLQLLLLRACMGAPKLNYLLRTVAPSLIVPALAEMKHILFLTLRELCVGIKDGFETFQFDLASLRIKDGGLGILNPLDISKYAYVASYIATRALQGRILCEAPANRVIPHAMDPVDGAFSQALDDLLEFLGETGMHRELPHYTQHHWAALYFEIKRKTVFSSPYISSQPSAIQRRFMAILQSFSAKHASAYLF